MSCPGLLKYFLHISKIDSFSLKFLIRMKLICLNLNKNVCFNFWNSCIILCILIVGAGGAKGEKENAWEPGLLLIKRIWCNKVIPLFDERVRIYCHNECKDPFLYITVISFIQIVFMLPMRRSLYLKCKSNWRKDEKVKCWGTRNSVDLFNILEYESLRLFIFFDMWIMIFLHIKL